MAYDSKCYELARHSASDSDVADSLSIVDISELSQTIQDAIEDLLSDKERDYARERDLHKQQAEQEA
jgi:hypothetical protein